jgi:hypothetical protein
MSATKRLIYQRADWLLPTSVTLQQAIQTAISRLTVAERDQPVSDDATETTGTWRKLIRPSSNTGCYHGKLVQFTHGRHQETIKLRPQPSADPEGAAQAPAGEEFSDGALYFRIDGNHVAIAQSQSLRIGQLELYLNWLLHERTQTVARGNYLGLRSIPPSEARDILARSTPKSVTIARPIEGLPRSVAQTQSHSITSMGIAIDAVARLLGIDSIRDLFPEEALESGRIKTSVTFSWSQKVGGSRPDEFLNGMGRVALRQLDEDPDSSIEIETTAGTITRQKLSLAQSYEVELAGGNPTAASVFDALRRFLIDLRQNREITD